MKRLILSTVLLAVALSGVVLLVNASAAPKPGTVLLLDRFKKGNGHGLVTNEYAFRNTADPNAVRSRRWMLTSGSLFVKNRVGWSGVPDGCKPDRYSKTCNDSAVFRMNTRRADFGNVNVSVRLLNRSLTTTSRTPAKDTDGIHIWLRHVSEIQLYAVSVNRRDSTMVIKKKCPGGPSNDGTYYTLGRALPSLPIVYNVWQRYSASVQNKPDGSVEISLSRDQVALTTVTDRGVGCPAITQSAAVGLRADNDNFSISNFTVTSLG